jgi:hypothetical protein
MGSIDLGMMLQVIKKGKGRKNKQGVYQHKKRKEEDKERKGCPHTSGPLQVMFILEHLK